MEKVIFFVLLIKLFSSFFALTTFLKKKLGILIHKIINSMAYISVL